MHPHSGPSIPTGMWKLGVVSFVNSLPLYQPLLDRKDISVVRAVPSRLAELLDAGECDAALLPIVDHLKGHGSGIVSDACIAADGGVTSVMLYSKVPVHEIRSVAADTSSHTSVALLRILFKDLFTISPDWHDAAPNLAAMLETADAALLIGDPALEVYLRPGKLHVIDLATAWKQLTGLPFVFAAWTARRGLDQNTKAELGEMLSQARDTGTQRIPELAREFARPPHLPTQAIEEYLTHAIKFKLDSRYHRAIEEFSARLIY